MAAVDPSDVAHEAGGSQQPEHQGAARLNKARAEAALDGLDRVTKSIRALDGIALTLSAGLASSLIFGSGTVISFEEPFAHNLVNGALLFKAISKCVFALCVLGGGLAFFFSMKRHLVARGDAYCRTLNASCPEEMIRAEPVLLEFHDSRRAQKWRGVLLVAFVVLAVTALTDLDQRLFLR